MHMPSFYISVTSDSVSDVIAIINYSSIRCIIPIYDTTKQYSDVQKSCLPVLMASSWVGEGVGSAVGSVVRHLASNRYLNTC